MPGFVAFHRRWALGSDDMLLPAGIEGVARIVWTTSIAVLMYRYKNSFDCPGGQILEVFCPGTIISNLGNAMLCALMIQKSMEGTLTDDWPRNGMKRLLYLKILSHLPDIACTALGSYWIQQNAYRCDPGIVAAAKWALIGSWGMIAFHWLVLFVSFDPVGEKQKKATAFTDLESGETITSTTARLWSDRIGRVSSLLRLSDTGRQTLTDISQLMFDFLEEKVDVVPSDIAAGLIMVSDDQTHYPEASALPRMHQAKPAKSWMNVSQAAHYMKFAWASYGWPYYLIFHRLPAAFALLKLLRCARLDLFGRYSDIEQDNMIQLNTAAILDMTGCPREDIIFISFHNKICELPFFISYDHKNKSVVVAIRGTLSLRDIMTDLAAVSDYLGKVELENRHQTKAHKGMIRAADYIRKRLVDKEILDLVKAKDYRLVITGHSLGAGTAALLTFMLRHDYPEHDIVCFAFSPPLLASLAACQETEEYLCTVLVGDDIVGRMGLYTVADLNTKVLTAIKNCDTPKHRIFNGWFERSVARFIGGSGALKPKPVVIPSKVSRESQKSSESISARNFKESLDTALKELEGKKSRYDRLYLPGCIIHITPQVIEGVMTYSATWKQAEDFDHMIISRHMIRHHCPDVVLNSLEWLRDRHQVPL